MTITDLPATEHGADALHVDHFGLSIGPVSVGLAIACTADDILRRYLDLIGLIQRGPVTTIEAPARDLQALSDATGSDCAYVARRLAVLQSAA